MANVSVSQCHRFVSAIAAFIVRQWITSSCNASGGIQRCVTISRNLDTHCSSCRWRWGQVSPVVQLGLYVGDAVHTFWISRCMSPMAAVVTIQFAFLGDRFLFWPSLYNGCVTCSTIAKITWPQSRAITWHRARVHVWPQTQGRKNSIAIPTSAVLIKVLPGTFA